MLMSFCIAHGIYRSALTSQGLIPGMNLALGNFSTYGWQIFLPELRSSRSILIFSGVVIPSSSRIYPSGPEIVIGLAPSSTSFVIVPQETLPKPETTAVFPSSVSPKCFSTSLAKNTIPKPVASVLPFRPPLVGPLPVIVPS